jgi:hypothetical protein
MRRLLSLWVVAATTASSMEGIRLLIGRPCREHPQLVAPCFPIRGRMTYWNGAPTVRIWNLASKRMLGVSDGRFRLDGYTNLPPDIAARLTWETDLFGVFVVCPFTRQRPGEMQLVCVDSATKLLVRPRRHD